MWRIFGRDRQGQRVEARVRQVPNANRNSIVDAARDVFPAEAYSALRQDVEQPPTRPIPGIDGVEAFGSRAAELVGRTGENTSLTSEVVRDERTGLDVPVLRWREGADSATVYHEPDAVVADISGLESIDIYADGEPVDPLTTCEFRAFGENEVAEGDVHIGQPHGPEALSLAKPQGLVMRIVRRGGKLITAPLKEPSDPFMQGRLKGSEEDFSVHDRHFPDIAEEGVKQGRLKVVRPAAAGPVLVFIHGTFACALPTLARFPPLKIPCFRFEHDTFLRVNDNSDALLGAIQTFAPNATHIFLVAHSRGGLVARVAGIELEKKRIKTSVLTFGTPHHGTPVANAGIRSYEALLNGGRTAVRAIPVWDAVSRAGRYLIGWRLSWTAPRGIEAMLPGNDFLRTLSEPSSLRSWGGDYRGQSTSQGLRYAQTAADGTFGGLPNDLVVSTASALGAGTSMPALSCNHFDFFETPEVQRVIGDLE